MKGYNITLMNRYLALTLITVLTFSQPRQAFSSTHVLVSVAPIHSLVSELMNGIAKPKLLLGKDVDFHHFSYKPSDLSKLNEAELLVWVGNGIEPDIQAHINSGLVDGEQLQLIKALDQSMLIPTDHASEVEHAHDDAINDPHIWFSPYLMSQAMQLIALSLQKLDPQHADHYQLNLERLLNKLNSLHTKIQGEFADERKTHYGVYHNAYQYFIRDAGLQSPIVFETSSHGQLSLKALRGVLNKSANKPRCVLVSNYDPYKKITRVMHSLGIKTTVTDTSSEESYFVMMEQLIADFKSCFEKG